MTTVLDPKKTAQGAAIELRNLSIVAGGRTLLDKADAQFEPNQVTLIVGESGAGKSLLLRCLAGLIDSHDSAVQMSGDIKIGQPDSADQQPPKVGVVFQHFALFDELSPLDNVRFAQAHRSAKRSQDCLSAKELLDELRVPQKTPTAALSGGQRQRLAIARTLAYNPDVILYDEPTSGLDPASSERAAALIKSTHSAHHKTSIIVTHDYQSLAPIADKIYFLDSENQTLQEIDRDDWSNINDLLHHPHSLNNLLHAAEESETAGPLPNTIAEITGNFFEATARAVTATVTAPLRLIPQWKSTAWGLRFVRYYLGLVAGPSAWLYIALAGAIIGFVSTYFTFRFLPYAQYTEPLLLEELLHSIGFALYRILTPVLATILIAARCGAAVASDVGGKSYGRQIDALRTFGVSPQSYLLTGVLFAFLLGGPLLEMIGYYAAQATSLVVFTAMYPDHGPSFWHMHFHREIIEGGFLYHGAGWLLSKNLLCAAGSALIAYHLGAREKNSTADVSRGITRTILWATLFVLAVHFSFALIEF